jgi:hypothetical protein
VPIKASAQTMACARRVLFGLLALPVLTRWIRVRRAANCDGTRLFFDFVVFDAGAPDTIRTPWL